MPKRDDTGPTGAGELTGRGLGSCAGAGTIKYDAGLGLACRRGFGRGFGRSMVNQTTIKTQQNAIADYRNKRKLKEQKLK